MELVYAGIETQCRCKVKEIEFVARFLSVSASSCLCQHQMCLMNCSDPKKSLRAEKIFIVTVDLYNTYHLCCSEKQEKSAFLALQIWTCHKQAPMQMHNRSVTLWRRSARRHVPSYQDAHGQTRTHKRALCEDVPGYSLTFPTFSPSIPPFLLVLSESSLSPSDGERERGYLLVSLTIFLFSCCPVSLYLTKAKVRSPPAAFRVPYAISGHACNFCLILSLGWTLQGARVFKVV